MLRCQMNIYTFPYHSNVLFQYIYVIHLYFIPDISFYNEVYGMYGTLFVMHLFQFHT